MKKILILQNNIVEYRMPIFNKLGALYDLTLGYCMNDESKSIHKFKTVKLDYHKIGPLRFYGIKFYKLCNSFDAVIMLTDNHNFSFCLLPFLKRKCRVIGWSIGLRCSYEYQYDVNRKHTLADMVNYYIFQACDALIFYMKKTMEFWKDSNLDPNKVFFANNTVAVYDLPFCFEEKKDFLFIGSLYKAKGVDLLLSTFNKLVKVLDSDVILHIVGDGGERTSLEEFVNREGLADRVIFHGALYDEKEIAQIFKPSLLCISPNQAGLSVPKSMGYGVTFVTRENAITGGELYHITPGKNGILFKNDEELFDILKDSILNRDKYIRIGKAAKQYYDTSANIDNMVNNISKAVTYAIDNV